MTTIYMAAHRHPIGFISYPVGKFCDGRVLPQSVERVVVALQFLITQHDVNIAVTGPAEVNDARFDILTIEHFFVAFIFVSRPWYKVVASEIADRSTT